MQPPGMLDIDAVQRFDAVMSPNRKKKFNY